MALPPDPIGEVLPLAAWVVDAEVAEILEEGPAPANRAVPKGFVDSGAVAGTQRVRLSIKRVLRGPALNVTELVVEKPVAPYMLAQGSTGPFLLDGGKPNPTILGRYGPDSYAWSKVEAALAKSL